MEWIHFFAGVFCGATVIGVVWLIVGSSRDAERWGQQLGSALDEDGAEWVGLEDVRVRVKPIYDQEKEPAPREAGS